MMRLHEASSGIIGYMAVDGVAMMGGLLGWKHKLLVTYFHNTVLYGYTVLVKFSIHRWCEIGPHQCDIHKYYLQ